MGNLLQGRTLIDLLEKLSASSLRGSLKDPSTGLLPDGQWLLDALDAKSIEEAETKNG